MPFPANSREMAAAGYHFSNFGVCRGCRAEIQWWKTPKGASLPMDPMPTEDAPAVSHWATCPERKNFKKK